MNGKEISGIVLTLLLASILILTLTIQQVRTDPETTITVPDDYEKIQWAIGNASDGDTVYVRAGTYYEQVNIDKSISLLGEDRETTIIDCHREYRAVTITADNVVLSGFTIQNATGDNLELSGNFATVRDNKVPMHACMNGIYASDSTGNSITDNIIENATEWIHNFEGISLHNTNETIITRNRISGCGKEAIFVYRSHSNTVSQNNVSSYLGLGDGIQLYMSSDNNVSGNDASSNGDGIYISGSCFNNFVSRNNCSSNHRAGIYIFGPEPQNNTVYGNTLSNNEKGIVLGAPSNNTIRGNTISLNDYGIYLYYSTTNDNQIFHNNLIDNTVQASIRDPCTNVWDDGYPSGGNYWSDYEDRYPDAEELDDSGIWDTPYLIDASNQDNYPLMEPWLQPPVPETIADLKAEIEELGSAGEIDNRGVVTSLLAKLDAAQRLVGKGKIDEAKSILEEDFIPQVQSLSGIHITPEAAGLLIQSAEYILSNL